MKCTYKVLAAGLLALICGCKRSNPLLGNWTSSTPADAIGAAGCPSHYTFTSDMQTDITAGHESTIQVSYSVQPNLVFVSMQLGSNGYRFVTPDSIAWTSGPCTYKRD